MTLPHAESSFCSSRSREAGENLFGTANSYGVYVAIEYNTPWTPDKDAGFVARTFHGTDRERWDTLWESLPNPRLQLIRQRGQSTDADGFTVYIAIPHEVNALLYQFQLGTYQEILDLEFPKLLTGDIDYHSYLTDDPLYLICTHARYDPCCARHGLPTYKAFSESTDTSSVWQSSHIGGHRFAGTGVILPYGLYYGRMAREDIPAIVDASQTGEVMLDYYRGRACYSTIEQSAEYFLRRESGNLRLDAFRLLESTQQDRFSWEVKFEELGTENQHTIQIKVEQSDWAIPSSCSKPEQSPRPIYQLVNYAITSQ